MSDKGKVALYGRVSTDNQDLDAQIEKLKDWFENSDYTDYDLYTEKVSSVKERPQFNQMMDRLDEYDAVIVTRLDRFGRSLRDTLQQIQQVNEAGSGILVIDDKFDVDTRGEEGFQQRIMRDFLTLFADVERRLIRMRMEEGYRKAHEEGRVGRPKKTTDKQDKEIYKMYEEDDMSMKNIMYKMNGKYEGLELSKSAVQRAINRVREDE